MNEARGWRASAAPAPCLIARRPQGRLHVSDRCAAGYPARARGDPDALRLSTFPSRWRLGDAADRSVLAAARARARPARRVVAPVAESPAAPAGDRLYDDRARHPRSGDDAADLLWRAGRHQRDHRCARPRVCRRQSLRRRRGDAGLHLRRVLHRDLPRRLHGGAGRPARGRAGVWHEPLAGLQPHPVPADAAPCAAGPGQQLAGDAEEHRAGVDHRAVGHHLAGRPGRAHDARALPVLCGGVRVLPGADRAVRAVFNWLERRYSVGVRRASA